MLNKQNKIFFPRLEENNIYRSYALCEREIIFQFFFFGKQPIENKPYFYKSFPLTKDSFPLTNYFLCYQILDNMKTIFIESFPAKQTECKLRNKSTSVKFQ